MNGAGLCDVAPSGRAAARRQRIVDAARRLFAANGFHATGVAQIAKESGILVGQIYRDFASKEDIVAQIVTADCAAFMAREQLDDAIAAGDHAAVWAWIRNLIEPDEPGVAETLFIEIVAESARNERIRDIFERTRRDADTPIRRALAFVMHPDTGAQRLAVFVDWLLAQSLGLQQLRALHPESNIAPIADVIVQTLKAEACAPSANDQRPS